MVGIGFRKDFAAAMLEQPAPLSTSSPAFAPPLSPAFIEVAPENWMGIGGYWKKLFRQALEQYPLFTHGLSLSIGSPDELDLSFLKKIKAFLKETNAQLYSEHLSYSKCDNAHLYDLLPIPFTSDAVHHVSQRIRQVQDFLEQKIAIEIVSYYTPVAPELTEIDFINAVLETADCDLLLDVNNVYVNSFNHRYDAEAFIAQLPLERVRYIHMAGHEQVADHLIIDTHGEAIVEPVYDLFAYTMKKINREVPALLERDFNIPHLHLLQQEMQRLEDIQTNSLKRRSYAIAG